jgi:tetratricopeptide (TPR) repeat protein/tRNA A-37 threonylcarbamoyl transferase component Bud32
MSAANAPHQGRDCPKPEELFAFAVGQLADDASESIAQHIEACPDCLAALQELNDRTDPLLADLRTPVPAGLFATDDRGPGALPGGVTEPSRGADPSPAPGAALANTTSPPTAPEPSGARGLPPVPGYEIIEEVGRGGMGVVYKARQRGLNRLVALKMVLAGMHAGSQHRVRFRVEAEAVARLEHANIVQIHEVGHHEGLPYLALEFVDGGSLAQRLDGTPTAADRAARLVQTLARAMEHAHRRGVIHRDLKPANVLLTADGVPKISDFGLAKRLESDGVTVATGAVMGTPSYMSPEQAAGKAKEIGPATDVYALGAILYELLTGRPPFKAETPSETLVQVQTQEPVSPSRLQHKLSHDLTTICLKCLAKEPRKRYASAEALADDLKRLLAGEPIRARPVGRAEKLWRWCRRNPFVAALLGACALLLVAGTAVSTWQAVRATLAEGLAQQRLGQATAEKERADEERAVAVAVNEFLQNDLLGAAAPDRNPRYKQVTLEEMLARAAARIPGKFVKQPRVEAAIRLTIGDTYRALGDYAAARPHLERAVEVSRRVLGEEHPDTLRSVNTLALLYQQQGQLADAEPLFAQALAVRRRVLGEEHPDTLDSTNNLAVLYKAQGQFAKAEPLLVETLAVSRRVLGEEHPDTLTSMNNLALLYQAQGQFAKAEPLFTQALALRRRVLGEEHPDTLNSTNNLAVLYKAQGQFAKAEPLYVRTLEARRRAQGEEHPHTLVSMNNLAMLYHAQREFAKAEPLYVRTLEARRRVLGEEHPETLISMNNLAGVYTAHGQFAKAEPLLVETLAVSRRVLGDEHPNTLISMNSLAVVYQAQRQFAKAEPVFAEAVAGARKKLGLAHATTQSVIRNLIDCYMRMGQPARAEPLCRELAEFWSRKAGPDSPPYAGALAALGINLLQQQEWAAAEPVLRDALAIHEKKEPDAWAACHMRSLLGGSLLGQNKYAEAEPLLLAGYEGMRRREDRIPPQGEGQLTAGLERLVQLYDAWGKKDKADPWRKKLAEAKGTGK